MQKNYLTFVIITITAIYLIAGKDGGAEQKPKMKIKLFNVEKNAYEEVDTVTLSAKEWQKILPKEQFCILRQKDTEMPFTGEHNVNKETGVYKCAACGTDLFISGTKFNSGSGWPSF